MTNQTKTYIVQESFAIRSGVQALPGEEYQLTDDEARAFLHYGRVRLKPPAPAGNNEEAEGGPDVETRDPKAGHRDPASRRRR